MDEFPAVSAQDIALAMEMLKDEPTTLMFHAEMLPSHDDPNRDVALQAVDAPRSEPTAYETFLESRPPSLETSAVEQILALAHVAPSLPLHIVHLSATQCIPLLRAARESGVPITAETCFHYLGLSAEDIGAGDTRHKCCPPIREQRNRDGLWEELYRRDSCIKTVVSDHSPCTPELKLLPGHLEPAVTPSAPVAKGASRGDFLAAWGGISSVGLGLPILHSAALLRRAADKRAPTLVDMVRLCSQATAAHVGLAHRKGGLAAGLDADVCVFDDTERWTFQQGDMRWKNRCSPWEGKEFVGRVRQTWVRGVHVFECGGDNGGFLLASPTGKTITERRTVAEA